MPPPAAPNDGQLVETLCDSRRSWAERRAALEALRRGDPAAIGALRASGRLLEAPWPAAGEGRALAGDALFVTAVCLPASRVAAVLCDAAQADADQLVLAARLAHAAAAYDAAAATLFEPALRGLLGDRRRAFPRLPGQDQSLGAYLQEIHLQTAQRLGAPAHVLAALAGAVRQSLNRGGDLASLYNPFLSWIRAGGEVRALTDLLVSVLRDRSCGAEVRLAARDAVSTLIGVLDHPDGVPPAAQEAGRAGLAAANAALLSILRAADEAAPLREAIIERLHRWAPDAIAALQEEGRLPTSPVPSRRAQKDWTPGTLERLSARVSFAEVLGLLADSGESDLDRRVTALRLAPAFTSWLPDAAARLSPLILALIPSRLPVPMKTRPIPLGDMALEIFPRLFPAAHEQAPWMGEAILAGIRAGLDAGCDLTNFAEWLPALLRPAALATVGDWLAAKAGDPSLPPARRQRYVDALESAGLTELARKLRSGPPGD